ncbi:MAG TPA: CYTH domain-containing protein [Candidatus Marinimicrobia bacterium]|nr:CYTH domain-containing protein [Candidatus Neomarinimicrobiota bacterium]HRS51562.1 CYTH domain-containing protein [Candidatus Neomarinimicrobiota bacterium]HRU92360.1 CYTH domain-containing protein [Candidatus Neomarinimicrobiota bacterium]
MGIEIERKFLVISDDYRALAKGERYRQGYLSTAKERVVRVRTVGQQAFLTIKGINVGAVRPEFEYEIPFQDAEQILENICEKPILDKIRYQIKHCGFIWEVDEFLGDNAGLVIAEIELTDENQSFIKPDWIGSEVTGDPRYFNSNLIKNPYKTWKTT